MLPTWLSFPLLFPYRVNVGSLGSLIPYSVNGPFKRTLMALFRLAWSNKLQLPIFITVCFMAFDIRLQLEINIFWEANHQNGRNRVPGGNGNAPIIVPVLEIHANEGDANSSDDSDDDDDDDDDTDSDETELHSLKDNNDSDDMEEDEDDDNERTKRNSRYFSEHQDPDQNNFSDDRNLNDSGSNNDNGSGNFKSSSTNSSNSNAGVSRTKIILPSDSNTGILSEELNKFFRSYCTTNSGVNNINVFNSWSKKNEKRQSQAMIQHSDFNYTSDSSIRNMSSSCPSPSAFSNWRCLPKNYYATNITNT